MNQSNFKTIASLALGVALISAANAHESNREAQLKAANDELTTRVAELLKENKRLEEFAKQALISTSNNQKVVAGCDTQDLRKSMVSGAGLPITAQAWLDRHGKNCNKEQLQYLRENLGRWSTYSQADPVRYVLFLLDN